MGQRIDDLGTFRASVMPLKALLTYRVSSLNARMNRQACDILRVHGNLKLPEWRILEVLGIYGELTGTRIVSLSGLDAGLVSRTLQGLEKRGIVSLRRSTADRRVIYAQPTDTGLAMVEVIFPLMQARQKNLLDALDPDEQKAIYEILTKLDKAASIRTSSVDGTSYLPADWSSDGEGENDTEAY